MQLRRVDSITPEVVNRLRLSVSENQTAAGTAVLLGAVTLMTLMWLCAPFLGILIILPVTVAVSASLGAFYVLVVMQNRDRSGEVRQSLVLQVKQQIDSGKQISLHDPSTLLLQPWYFDLRVAEEIARCQRYGTKMAVLRLAIGVTDEIQADWAAALSKELARNLHRAVRSTDLVARHGENEYVACLPQTHERGVAAAARRMAQMSPALPVTIGWAICPSDGTDFRGLLEKASLPVNERDFAEVIRLNPKAAATDRYAEIFGRVRDEICGNFSLQPAESVRSLKLKLRKAARQIDVALRIWDEDGSVFFERLISDADPKAS